MTRCANSNTRDTKYRLHCPCDGVSGLGQRLIFGLGVRHPQKKMREDIEILWGVMLRSLVPGTSTRLVFL
jgi:hypothetical protein